MSGEISPPTPTLVVTRGASFAELFPRQCGVLHVQNQLPKIGMIKSEERQGWLTVGKT